MTDTTQRRLDVAVELFVERQESLAYEGIVLSKDKNRALHINSYSEFRPDNTTPEMAREKIRRAKLVLDDLCNKSPTLAAIARSLPHEHYLCHDYGMGYTVLAQEIGGVFEWCYGRNDVGGGGSGRRRSDVGGWMNRGFHRLWSLIRRP